MSCSKNEVRIPDLATKVRIEATNEVKRKNIIKDLYYLASHSNPYGIRGIVVKDSAGMLTVHYCGELVFVWSQAELKRYICKDDWTDIVSNEVTRIKDERRKAVIEDEMRKVKNELAKRNYVVCHQ